MLQGPREKVSGIFKSCYSFVEIFVLYNFIMNLKKLYLVNSLLNFFVFRLFIIMAA